MFHLVWLGDLFLSMEATWGSALCLEEQGSVISKLRCLRDFHL